MLQKKRNESSGSAVRPMPGKFNVSSVQTITVVDSRCFYTIKEEVSEYQGLTTGCFPEPVISFSSEDCDHLNLIQYSETLDIERARLIGSSKPSQEAAIRVLWKQGSSSLATFVLPQRFPAKTSVQLPIDDRRSVLLLFFFKLTNSVVTNSLAPDLKHRASPSNPACI